MDGPKYRLGDWQKDCTAMKSNLSDKQEGAQRRDFTIHKIRFMYSTNRGTQRYLDSIRDLQFDSLP